MEVARIRAHFDSVLNELYARDLDQLTGHQRQNRAALITALREYRDRGVFPHNYDFPGRAVPYFIDRKTGTRCAVAYLIESTGRGDIVSRVARDNNNVWVGELAGDAQLAAWLSENGVTLDEAARIQVPYMQPVSKAEEARNVAFVAATPFAIGGVAITSLWNALGNSDGHSKVGSTLGIASGVLSTAMGASLLAKSDIPMSVGATAVTAGMVSMALGVRARFNHETVLAEREAERTRQVSIVPTVARSGAGISVSLPF